MEFLIAAPFVTGSELANVNKAFFYRQDFEKVAVIEKVIVILKKNKENN